LTDDKPPAETTAASLARLRAQSNRLRRELDALRRRHARETAQRDACERMLRRELEDIRGSTLWRIALRLRRLRPYRALSGLRARLGGGRAACAEGRPAIDRRAARYQAWIDAQDPRRAAAADMAALAALAASGARRPLISVVMPVYNTEPSSLAAAVASVTGQVYENWELCMVDDGSEREATRRALDDIRHPGVRLERLDANAGIAAATNRAMEMAAGEYIAFLDHDDTLSPDALSAVALEISRSGADLIYSDEDFLDAAGGRVNPHFKPDLSPDLLLSHNYVTHLLVVSRELAVRTGPLDGRFSGAQDYDFVLRASEQARAVRHLPRILYHWRMGETSTSLSADSKPDAAEHGRRAIEAALARRGWPGRVAADPEAPHFYQVRYSIRGRPGVSIVIPFRDRADLLHGVVGDIVELSTYPDFEVVGVSNDSREPETFEAMADLSGMDERVRFIEHDIPFRYSDLVNFGAASTRGEHLLLLNNDIRLISTDWIEALLEHSQRGEVGAVGGKLYFPDGAVQHAGVIIGIDGFAGHAHKGFPGDHRGYFNRLRIVHNVSAVTGAMMMVKRSLYDSLHGFDTGAFAVAGNDVDFCLRLRRRGLWNVFTPFAEAWHLESASRGYEDTPDKARRHAREREAFRERHGDLLAQGDPFYNPNLEIESADFCVRAPAAGS